MKTGLIKASTYEALERFLHSVLKFDLYLKEFEENLTETMLANVRDENRDEYNLQSLAREYARNQPDAVEKVNDFLDAAGLNLEDIFKAAKAKKAVELARAHARREPEAVKQMNELLTTRGVTMPDIFAEKLAYGALAQIERIDRLITIAETRRNASLREIERYRAVLGQALRRSVQELEHGEFKVIEMSPPGGKSVA